MSRTPTDLWAAYAPWRAKLAGEKVPLHADSPEPGFYWRRFVRGGPRVPVAIWIEQEIDPATGELTAPERIVALCNGKLTRADVHWNYCCDNAITQEEYDAAVSLVAPLTNDADAPAPARVDPTKPTDPLSVPPIF